MSQQPDVETPRTREITLKDLRVGMFVTSLHQSWFKSPFLRHRFLIQSPDQIEQLRQAGVSQITIDLAKGRDVDARPAPSPAPAASPGTNSAAPAAPPAQAAAPVEPGAMAAIPLPDLRRELLSAERARNQVIRTVSVFYEHLTKQGAIDVDQATDAVREMMIVMRTLTDASAFTVMSQGRNSDPSLATHAMVTTALSLIIGHALDLGLHELQDLATGALLHDIGLIGMPRTITSRVNETSRGLSRRELEQYQSHCRSGALRVKQLGRFSNAVIQIIEEHHALPNGRGFPQHIDANNTDLLSRIVMLIDRYDNLLTGFGGATPLQPHDAIQRLFLEAQDHALDPMLTTLFIRRIGIFPIYSILQLNTGELAIVTELNEHALHQPVVYLTHDARGHALDTATLLSLADQDPSEPTRSVVRVLNQSPSRP